MTLTSGEIVAAVDGLPEFGTDNTWVWRFIQEAMTHGVQMLC
jgi:hypothetical protein